MILFAVSVFGCTTIYVSDCTKPIKKPVKTTLEYITPLSDSLWIFNKEHGDLIPTYEYQILGIPNKYP